MSVHNGDGVRSFILLDAGHLPTLGQSPGDGKMDRAHASSSDRSSCAEAEGGLHAGGAQLAFFDI